jgi:hypothetical protein
MILKVFYHPIKNNLEKIKIHSILFQFLIKIEMLLEEVVKLNFDGHFGYIKIFF